MTPTPPERNGDEAQRLLVAFEEFLWGYQKCPKRAKAEAALARFKAVGHKPV